MRSTPRATSCSSRRRRSRSSSRKVDQEVESLKQNWQGDDSKQFEQEWTGTHRPELQKAQKLLTEMKTTIDHEVQQQRETSSQY